MGFQGLGFRASGLGFNGLGPRVEGLEHRVWEKDDTVVTGLGELTVLLRKIRCMKGVVTLNPKP